MKRSMMLLASCLALAWSGVAAAQATVGTPCPAPLPQPSDAGRPSPVGDPPAMPPCINPQTHMSTCPKKQLDRFNAAIDAYNTQVTAWNQASGHYVNALNDWTNSVSIYSMCEVQRLNSQRPGR